MKWSNLPKSRSKLDYLTILGKKLTIIKLLKACRSKRKFTPINKSRKLILEKIHSSFCKLDQFKAWGNLVVTMKWSNLPKEGAN
jgi:hypothetical protein